MVDLEGKVVIVTGASSGIGAALARGFSDRRARLTLASRRVDRLEKVALKCSGEVSVVGADLAQEADRRKVGQQTIERWGRIDILVNNAGLGGYGQFLSTTEGDWRRIFEINLFALVFMTHAALPFMQSQGSGIVVNMASIGGLIHRGFVARMDPVIV